MQTKILPNIKWLPLAISLFSSHLTLEPHLNVIAFYSSLYIVAYLAPTWHLLKSELYNNHSHA